MFKQYFCKVNQPAQNIFLSKEIGGQKKNKFFGWFVYLSNNNNKNMGTPYHRYVYNVRLFQNKIKD